MPRLASSFCEAIIHNTKLEIDTAFLSILKDVNQNEHKGLFKQVLLGKV